MQVSYKSLMEEVRLCNKCALAQNRKNTVFGEGDIHSGIMLVGEGPGANEDETGRPFVGQAGMLLDKMLLSIGIPREKVYICIVVKCRPPGNRVPSDKEAETCLPYLRGAICSYKTKNNNMPWRYGCKIPNRSKYQNHKRSRTVFHKKRYLVYCNLSSRCTFKG